MIRSLVVASLAALVVTFVPGGPARARAQADTAGDVPESLAPAFRPPPGLADDLGAYRSPLIFDDGSPVSDAAGWERRRREIRDDWHAVLGAWPPLIERPKFEVVNRQRRDDFEQRRVRLEVAPDRTTEGYLLVPDGGDRRPAVLVVFYEPETAAGLKGRPQLDFAYQLARRGFVALSIGFDPSGIDPSKSGIAVQPLSYLAYVAANAYNAMAELPEVDPARVGVMGLSYGGKWAMFASCLYDKFACAVWSDPGIVFDEARPNVNYWEPWYLGWEPGRTRRRGVINEQRPRTGAYRRLREEGRDLHELHALMAPRPFLVSGGSEDRPERWQALNHTVAVNALLGRHDRVAMTNRPGHLPTAEANEQAYRFLEFALKAGKPAEERKESPEPSPTAEEYKSQVVQDVEAQKKQAQVMNDMVFSFGELGFQEVETSKYLTGILEKEGFAVQRGIAGIPTAWMATWGSGRPVIALGSDIDCIPQASQRPGVPRHEPLIEGAPGHGEGHNSGQPLNITAAIAVKRLMERARLSGTLKLWPGVAEEQLGTKAYYVRDGYFRDVDVALFTHVASDFSVSWGPSNGTGLVSVEYTFNGEAAHAGSAPWRGRSALDAVELMNIGWNFRREHLRTQQRSHYVITGGGDQPNVVPPVASVWYYFRELDEQHIRRMREIGDAVAKGAAMMTETTVNSRVLGSAWPQHFNRPVAEAMARNIERVGMPKWSAADQALAKAVQRELKQADHGLETKLKPLTGPVSEAGMTRGGSDDIGDISWTVPTVTLRYPANIPELPGHHWSNAIAMATPIAHQGVVAGAKALAMTMVDLLVRPELVADARGYFRDVQTKDTKYKPLISSGDRPAIWLNKRIMDDYRERMRRFYYDPAAHDTYLEQLGIGYPDQRGAGPASSTEK